MRNFGNTNQGQIRSLCYFRPFRKCVSPPLPTFIWSPSSPVNVDDSAGSDPIPMMIDALKDATRQCLTGEDAQHAYETGEATGLSQPSFSHFQRIDIVEGEIFGPQRDDGETKLAVAHNREMVDSFLGMWMGEMYEAFLETLRPNQSKLGRLSLLPPGASSL